jgi:choline-glycine betaine transporter
MTLGLKAGLLFLGRLSYGYTVRQFMIVNWILPSLFGMIWMSIFSGTVIDMQLNQGINLNGLLSTLGPESIVYKMFETLPMKGMIAVVFLFTAFLSYVTAADSNTEAMGGISSTGISPDTPSPPKFIKVLWGITIGAVAFIMISLAGVDGVKMLSNLGGLPALFLIIAINTGLIKVLFFTKKN